MIFIAIKELKDTSTFNDELIDLLFVHKKNE